MSSCLFNDIWKSIEFAEDHQIIVGLYINNSWDIEIVMYLEHNVYQLWPL